MPESKMCFDRYHGTMCKFALTPSADLDGSLAEKEAVFYVTQRKIPFAPCVGHERLIESLLQRGLDVPRLRFLKQDKADLSKVAELLESSPFPFSIRTVAPGTIMFANEPLADIKGPFAKTQMMEVKFEHAFDEPMTIAGNALAMRLAAGNRALSDFSLRRDGTLDRAIDVARYSYIAGFDDTSNMEAAFLLDINAVGTMAHYLVQAFRIHNYKIYSAKDAEKNKHFQQVAFEKWLDAHPNGTTLLLDTISVKLGTIHAIRAAKSSDFRHKALKAVRIDSEDLIQNTIWVRAMLDRNSLKDVAIILTSDLDAKRIREAVAACPFIHGFGVGTKLLAETTVAGVIFKLCSINRKPTLKCSGTIGKETLPSELQVWRCVDDQGFYVKDIISLVGEAAPQGNFVNAIPLLKKMSGDNLIPPSIYKQRGFVKEQLVKFRDIRSYPIELSASVQLIRDNLLKEMQIDPLDETGVEMIDFPK